jgi:DNA polymerase-3 subunit beta
MHCIVLRNNLKDGLGTVANAKKESSQLPVLRNVLLEARDNKIRLSATDLEIGIVHAVSGKVLAEGAVTVPFSVFQQIINNAASERIELESKGNTLHIITDSYNGKIATAPKDDFPIIPDLPADAPNQLAADAGILTSALQVASAACHASEFRPELSGVLLDVRDGVVYAVATDSFRLSRVVVPKKKITISPSVEASIIVPQRTITEIIRIFSGEEGQVQVLFDENQIVAKNEHTRITSRLIDGKFPDYTMVIPKSFEAELSISKTELMQALRLTSSLSNRLNEIKIKLDDSLKSVQLLSASHEFGESEYVLSVKAKGLPLSISYNWRFLLDGLKNVPTETVFIGINSEQKPSLIQAPDDEGYMYVLTSIKAA